MMAGVRPFRFIIGSRGVVDARTVAERARWAESIGCSHVAVHDHLAAQHAPIPLLTTVAMATERIRLLPLVFNNDLRHPAVLAHELASLDILSGGRVDVGIGAGWNEPEYRASGLTFARPGIRIDRMREAVAIMRGLFADGPFSYSGRYYTVTEMEGQPKPIQRPHPPFVIGGTREHVLRVAAREGDVVGIDLRQDGAAILDAFEKRMDVRVGWIRDEAGGRIDRLDLSVLRLIGDISVTDQPVKIAADVARQFSGRTGASITAEDVLESPFSLIGTIPDLVDKLVRIRQRWGINSFLIGWFDEPQLRDLVPVVERLADQG
jgi:probable F420-dependent oxidoreductase